MFVKRIYMVYNKFGEYVQKYSQTFITFHDYNGKQKGDEPVDIGTRLKQVREGKASQQQIAELLNTTQQQVSKYENNIQEIPCRHIITLALYFNVTADYLLGLTDTPSKLK